MLMNKMISIYGSIAALVVATGCGTTAQQCCPSEKPAAVEAKVDAPAAVSAHDKPGFVTSVVKGRLWVFRDGSKELAAFREAGKGPAVHTVRPLAGPDRMTLIAVDGETIVDYMVAKPGFHTVVKEGRLWVFAEGSEALAAFKASGKTPAVHSTRVKAGPMGMTIIAPDLAVLDAYMQ